MRAFKRSLNTNVLALAQSIADDGTQHHDDSLRAGEVVRNDRPIGGDDAFGGPCYHGIVQPRR